MEKLLKLYKYIDGVNDVPFPNEEQQVITSDFRYDVKRMGGAPMITCTIMHVLCLDKIWDDNVYTYFNGERFYIKQVPSSSYDHTDSRYKHEVELVSERIVLDNVYFYDVVDEDDYSKPVSNSTSFTFFGDIHEFAHRLNQSLKYSKVGYNVVVDDGISSEAKQVSFKDQVFSNVLQEAFNTYEIPYYFDGKTIHIGFTNNTITKTFKYGSDESLLSIQKQNANYKIVNRVTGVGSSDNIPYYYPNFDEKGVTRLLYNGEVGGVSVINQTKYKKVKLGTTFVYDATPTVTTELFDRKDYKLGYYSDLYTPEGEIEPGFTRFQVQFSYSFYLNEMQQVRLDLNSLSDNSIRIDFTVVRQEGGYIEQFFDKNHFEGSLGQGTYNVLITWEFKDIMSPNAIQDWQMKAIIDRDFVAYGDTVKEGYTSWMYNNAPVKLYDYGMEVNVEPNDGDTITFERVSYLQPQESLMPSIYRETNGENRFYNALNNTYVSPQTGEYYHFNNPYIDGKPKEHIVNFEDIKPTIKGMTNSNGLRIDMFTEFAYDLNDNDEFDEEGEYLHPYFFGKLRRMDGEYGFNLFDHAIEEDEMVISMTSGSCGSCEWIIGVSEDRQENIVQVDERGNLLRDANGNVIRSGSAQPQQNDTINNEVWIALKKDSSTFGVVMPNANANYKPQAGDTFVILHIDLPQAYILDAENRLKEELIKYMATNNDEKFNFSISFSRIFFAENPDILSQLNENSRIRIEYDNEVYKLYISSYSYSMSRDNLLPEIRIELSDTLTISQNALQTAISDVKSEILSSIGGYANVDILKQGLKYFLRKDKDDKTTHNLGVGKSLSVGEGLEVKGSASIGGEMKSDDFVAGDLMGSGWSIYRDSNGNTVVETDRIVVRKSLEATELVVNQETFEKGSNIFVKGGCTITKVEIANGRYRCYYNNEEGRRFSGFKVGDQARCQRYNASYGGIIKYYWRLVTGVEEDYIELSMTDCDGTGIPEEGDDIAQLGSRYDKTRQSAIVISPDNGGSVIIWAGIDSFDLSEKNMVGMGVNPNTGRAYLYGYGDMFFGDRNLEKNYITYQTREGDTEPTLNINADIHFGKGSDGLSNLSEFKDIQNEVDNLFGQIEREFTIWYYDYEPTLDNEPAVNWVTDADKALHDQDIFFSDKLARAWRFVNGAWVEITDERTLSALKLAEDAHAAAAEAEKNAKEAKGYIDNILPSKLEELQNQIDGAIESFFYKYDPTTSNEPASLWTTEEQKAMHLNDTFTNLESGYSWRWTVNGGVYGWIEISDTATVKALVAAGQAQDTADQKRRVFVATPYTPYDEGDLWVQGETGDILRCSNSRASGNFDSSDWVKASKYTDDSALQSFIENDYKAQLASIQSQMDKRAETWYQVEDPSLAWTTQELKQLHAGDLWYNINKGLSYMWSGTEWVIQGVPDEVFDTIDGKASIYTSQPSSYKKNDLWILASDTTLDKAYKSGTIVVAKQDSDTFVASHWTKKDSYTDDSALETFLNGAYKEQLEAIQSQIDSRAETWYQSTDPSLQWTTDALKQQHVGDLWYDINKAQSFMWNGSEWVVQGVPDEVYDKIDGKSSIYTSQPSAYKKNDLWILASDTTLDKAYKSGTIVVAKQDSNVFVKEHWTKKDCYTDDSAVAEFINGVYKNQIDEIKGQIDKKSETWYQNTDPSLNWDTTQKNEHKGDLWYNTNEDQTYIWSGTVWIPQGVPDEVFDKIDGKAQIFVSRPNSYNKNDLWVLEQDMTLDKDYKKGTIVIAATSSNYFVATHWTKLDRYTDDSRADEAYGKAEEAYRKAESFSEDLTGVLADMEIVMNQVDREFTIWYYNHVPTLNNAPAVDWDTVEEKQRHDQDICFADELARAWRFVNGQWVEITDERTLAVLKISEDAKSDAEDAKKNADEAKDQATAAANRVANVEYLKDTFGKNETIIDGGVYISKLVSVKNEEENIEAFLNGSNVGKDAEHGKLILAGGIPESGGNLEERSRNALTRIYEDGTLISENVKVKGEIHATSGTFDNVHINGTIRTRWELLKYKVLYYTSSSIEQWGFDGSAIYNDKIILVGGIGTPELLMAWGDDADGRELAICNRCVRLVSGTDLGVAVKVKVPTGKYIVGLDGTKVSGGNEFNIDGKKIYYMVGFNEGWYVTNILNLND